MVKAIRALLMHQEGEKGSVAALCLFAVLLSSFLILHADTPIAWADDDDSEDPGGGGTEGGGTGGGGTGGGSAPSCGNGVVEDPDEACDPLSEAPNGGCVTPGTYCQDCQCVPMPSYQFTSVIFEGSGEIISVNCPDTAFLPGEESPQCQVTWRCNAPGDLGFQVTVTSEEGETIDLQRVVMCLPKKLLCGNGKIDSKVDKAGNVLSVEECDDGNTVNGDGCSDVCTGEILCGDGRKEGQEECDDENISDHDGCDSQCRVEDCKDIQKDGVSLVDEGGCMNECYKEVPISVSGKTCRLCYGEFSEEDYVQQCCTNAKDGRIQAASPAKADMESDPSCEGACTISVDDCVPDCSQFDSDALWNGPTTSMECCRYDQGGLRADCEEGEVYQCSTDYGDGMDSCYFCAETVDCEEGIKGSLVGCDCNSDDCPTECYG